MVSALSTKILDPPLNCKRNILSSKLVRFEPVVASEQWIQVRTMLVVVEISNLPVVLIIHWRKKRTRVRNEASLLPSHPSVPVKHPIHRMISAIWP